MLERYNFYDVFGYLIPGLALLACLGIPLAMALDMPLQFSLGEALALVVAGFIVGLGVQEVARVVVPSRTRLAGDRYPSERVLGPDGFHPEFLSLLAHKINRDFALDIQSIPLDEEGLQADEQKVIDHAFRLCRAALNQRGKLNYPEKLQSLQVVTRGLYIATTLGWWLIAGLIAAWVAATTLPQPGTVVVGIIAVVLFAVSVGALVGRQWRAEAPHLFGAVAGFLGAMSGATASHLGVVAVVALGAAAALLFVFAKSVRDAHDRFARDFARSVYIEYAALRDDSPGPSLEPVAACEEE